MGGGVIILDAVRVSSTGHRGVDVTPVIVHLQAHVSGAYQWARYYRDKCSGLLARVIGQQRYANMMNEQLLALRGVWEAL